MTQIDSKELSVVRAQATKALTAATELVINNQESLVQATDVLSKIKTVGKMITERKEAITKPLNEALKSARDLFKPIESSHAEAERIIKSKIVIYQTEQERIQNEEKAKLAARVEKGTMKAETAVKKMESMEEVPKTVQGNVGTVSMRTVKKLCITDPSLVPREYCEPSPMLIKAALEAGKTVPGAEMREEKIVSAR